MNTENKMIIVTGTGYKVVGDEYKKDTSVFLQEEVKANIGAWVAKVLADAGLEVILVSKTEDKLKVLYESIKKESPGASVSWSATDLMEPGEVKKFIESIPQDKHISLVHCAGLSASSYKVPNDNPYLAIEDTPIEFPKLEFDSVVRSLLIIIQALMPRFLNQKETRVVVNTSMSGIRPVPLGYSHSSAKAGFHHAVRSLTLELNKRNIFVSEILPGAVNTGLYDTPEVQDSVVKMAKYFGYDYDPLDIPQMHPRDVAEAVKLALTSNAHILSINLVPKGQWPNIGA